MANIKKCDRCGKHYEIPTKSAPLEALSEALDMIARTARELAGTDVPIIDRVLVVVDLCPECKKSLKKWIKNPEKQEEAEPPTEGERCAMCGEIISEGREKLVCPWCACGIHNNTPSHDPEGRV